MNDILADLRDDNGDITDLAEACERIAAANKLMVNTVEVTTEELLGTMELHFTGVTNFLAAQHIDLVNEVNEMWNILHKVTGGKDHRKRNTQEDLDLMIQGMTFARLMAMYNLLSSKGGNASGLVVPS